ncbi:hypothetical protein OC835_003362 [Tilletia horrida]|nr:hypothetical protein OC835_003362 [Tilletia horrida]
MESTTQLRVATAPAGWSLSPGRVLQAALLSRRKQEELGMGADALAPIRLQAIGHVRRQVEASSGSSAPDDELSVQSSELSSEAQTECQAVINAVENWTPQSEETSKTPLPETPAQDGQGPAESSIRRPIPASSTIDEPSAKRARMAGPTESAMLRNTASTNSSAPASGSNVSAMQQFFQRPALVAKVFLHLEFDQADLLTLARVSKSLRAAVMPRIVQKLNIPLRKARRVHLFLTANPTLIQHVQYLRIWDDIAHHYGCYNPETAPAFRNQIAPRSHRDTWKHLGDLLVLIQTSRQGPPPFLDLSFGQVDLFNLYTQLKRAPKMLQKVTALRFVDDSSPKRYPYLTVEEVEASFNTHGDKMSEELSDIVHLVCDAQDDARSDALHVFEFVAFRLESNKRGPVLPAFRPRLLKRLASRIRSIVLLMGKCLPVDVAVLKILLDAHWPNLQRFWFRIDEHARQLYPSIRPPLISFLHRHNYLLALRVEMNSSTITNEDPPWWENLSAPALKKCTLSGSWGNNTLKMALASRHDAIQDLMLYGAGDVQAFACQAGFVRGLRALRGEASSIKTFLLHDAFLKQVHIEFAIDDLVGFNVFDHLGLDANSASALTCLSLLSDDADSPTVTQHATTLVPLDRLPNLVEVSLIFGKGQDENKCDSRQQSAQLVADLFMSFAAAKSSKLKACYIAYDGGAELPADAELATIIKVIPATLQYLTYYIPFWDEVWSYRVVRPVEANASSCPRLQRLPAFFRPRVDAATGVWEDMSDLDVAHTMFDHLGDEPRLKYL